MIRTKTRGAALLATVAIALAGCTGGSTEEPSTSAPATSTKASDGGGSSYPTEGTSAAASPAAECKADSSDQEVPSEAPQTDAWPAVNGTGVPVSNTFGPINREGDVWSCFAHSPKGALFAAAYIRGASGMPAVRAAYFDDPVTEEGQTSAEGVQLRGYRVTAYDQASVAMELVYETSNNGESGLVAFPVTVYWEGDQWKVHRSDLEASSPKSITGLTGYVQWSVQS